MCSIVTLGRSTARNHPTCFSVAVTGGGKALFGVDISFQPITEGSQGRNHGGKLLAGKFSLLSALSSTLLSPFLPFPST